MQILFRTTLCPSCCSHAPPGWPRGAKMAPGVRPRCQNGPPKCKMETPSPPNGDCEEVRGRRQEGAALEISFNCLSSFENYQVSISCSLIDIDHIIQDFNLQDFPARVFSNIFSARRFPRFGDPLTYVFFLRSGIVLELFGVIWCFQKHE